MKPEYFPHGEDIILQNETPTDMYIMVNGAAVSSLSIFCFPYFSLLFQAVTPHFFLMPGFYFTHKCIGKGKRPTLLMKIFCFTIITDD